MKKNTIIILSITILTIAFILLFTLPKEQSRPDILLSPQVLCTAEGSCDTATCNTQLNLCVQESEGCSLLLGTNNTNSIDILFIVEGMKRTEAIHTVNNMLGTQDIQGLLTTKPFNENRESFNIWFAEKEKSSTKTPDRKETKIVAGTCPQADKTITISKQNFRSYCYFSGDCYLSITTKPKEFWGRLLLHEFGHGFGGLADEYVEEELGNKPRSPNCAPDEKTAKEWWGDNSTMYTGSSSN